MDWSMIAKDIIYALIIVFIPIMSNILIQLIGALSATLQENLAESKYARLRDYIVDVDECIKKVVNEVNQTYVDSMKATGSFTIDAHSIAKEKAVKAAKSLIGDEFKDAVETLYGDFDKYLDTVIEATVKDNK